MGREAEHPEESTLRKYANGVDLGDEHHLVEGHIRDCDECTGALEDIKHAEKEKRESSRIHDLSKLFH